MMHRANGRKPNPGRKIRENQVIYLPERLERGKRGWTRVAAVRRTAQLGKPRGDDRCSAWRPRLGVGGLQQAHSYVVCRYHLQHELMQKRGTHMMKLQLRHHQNFTI